MGHDSKANRTLKRREPSDRCNAHRSLPKSSFPSICTRGLTPTAADPKEKLPSESGRGCSEKVLKASREPFRVEGLRFGVESFTRNVVSPHLGAERAQLRVEKRMRRKAEDGREGTVASGFGTRGALRRAFGASSGTRNRPRWRIPTSGRPSTAERQET